MRRHDRDWLSSLCQFSNRLGVAVQNRFAGNAVEIGFERQMGTAGCSGDLGCQLDVLRKTRHRHLDRPPGDLGGLVEIQGRELLPQHLLDALLIIQAADPDLRAVGQLDVEIRPVPRHAQRGEAQLQHLGHRVGPDRRLRVIEPKAPDRVAAAGGINGSLNDVADDQESLARARTAAKHDVARGAVQQGAGFALAWG